MRRTFGALSVCAMLLAAFGCRSYDGQIISSLGSSESPADAAGGGGELQAERKIVWRAELDVRVGNVSNAVRAVAELVERQGGFVERKSDEGEKSARLTLRVPAKSFKGALSGLESLGTVTSREVSGEDVTEQYVDVEARLKNKRVLRDRLQALLAKANEVKDILAIEAELNRVQSDLDSMEARLNALRGKADFATVQLRLERKPVPGPLGYLFKGLFWAVEKLFVIRE
jgi:hypothetical protein